jgi:putative membrane protein
MLGSLNKVWPWKNTIEFTLNRHGKEIPLVQENILPATFEAITAEPAYLWYSIALMIFGAGAVLLLEKVGSGAQE